MVLEVVLATGNFVSSYVVKLALGDYAVSFPGFSMDDDDSGGGGSHTKALQT